MKLKQALFLVFLLFSSFVWAQNSSNPFEIKQRVSSVAQDTAVAQNDLIQDEVRLSGNPFEVNHVPLRKNKLKEQNDRKTGLNATVSNSFIFWAMMFAWALLARVLTSKKKLLSNLTRSLFNENILKLTKREENGGLNLHYILLYVVFFINASVFLYLMAKKYFEVEGMKLWAYTLIALVVLYLLKHIALFFIGVIFPLSKETSLYNYCIMVFNLMIGIILIPFDLMLAFGSEIWSSPTIFLCLIVLGILILLRYFRGVLIVVNKAFGNIFVFFIYLCTLEIAPLLVLVRFLSSFS